MAAKIIWTRNALDDLEELKTYLETHWPEAVLIQFLNTLVDKVKLLQEIPEIGRSSSIHKNRRRVSLTKHNILIYSVQGETIIIESIFDTRQDSEKLRF